MKKLILLLPIFLFIFSFGFSESSFKPEDILKKYDKDGIINYFETYRKREPIHEFHEKKDGFFFLTTIAYYQVGINDDGTLRFRNLKSRREYDAMIPFWTMVILFILSGVAILMVIFIPQKKKLP